MDAIPSRVTGAALGVEATGAWYDWTAGTKIIVVSRWRTREFHGSLRAKHPQGYGGQTIISTQRKGKEDNHEISKKKFS